MRAWLSGHRSLAATCVSMLVVAAVIVGFAVASDGYRAQRIALNDAAVWLTSQSKRLVGRANTAISQIDSAVPQGTAASDVVQSGTTILAVDHGDNTVSLIDAATSTEGKSVPLPPRDPAVHIAGSRVTIESAATGQLWIMPASSVDTFEQQSTPTVNFGGAIVSAIEPGGRYFAYTPGTGQIHEIDAATDSRVAKTTPLAGEPLTARQAATAQLTAVGAQWALLVPRAGRLELPGRSVRLPSWLGSDAVVQQASSSGGLVYVASPSGLASVSLRDGAVRTVMRGSLGRPAAPVQVGDCAYAGWAAGASWSRCGTEGDGRRATLSRIQAGAALTYRINDGSVVLNDTASGISWAVQHDNAVIDNWSEFVKRDEKAPSADETTSEDPPPQQKDQEQPVAVDDQLGARPGVASVLPVLLNDYDANDDVLTISAVDPIPASQGRLDLINNDQELQLTLPADAVPGSVVSFGYTISDGRGGSAGATVTVTVRAPDQNSPPVQVQQASTVAVRGGRVTTEVLAGWYDPDGDPIYLSSASVAAPDGVSYTPGGSVVYTDKGEGGTRKEVALVVSDGRSETSGTLTVAVHDAGSVPIIADPFVATAAVGEDITVRPLAHVRGGSGPLRLSAVPAKPDSTIVPDYDGGTFRFSATTTGTHYLDFAVTDGATTATGVVRIDVTPPPEPGAKPVTVPHTAFVAQQGTQNIDVLASDFDPAGGVLLITGVSGVPAASGIQLQTIDHRIFRVTLTRPLAGPASFQYTVSNGSAEASGAVTVIEVPPPAVRQPPVANPDTASVRVGDSIDIPVLANDVAPDDQQLTLATKLVTAPPGGGGLLFASGSVLRYLAPEKPGDYMAAYRVDSSDGQWATAEVTIHVREIDAATNNPPVPTTVTARVFAGGTVRIPIPLTGIDPDGDSVKLLGQESNPQHGAVVASGSNYLEYTAGQYASGTDTFSYGVVDSLGARASGTVRVGIAPQSGAPQNPVAIADAVEARPGKTVTVRVLENDSDPAGSPLHVTSVSPQSTGSAGAKARVTGNTVTVRLPDSAGRYGFIYDIADDSGGTSSAFLSVVASKDAPLAVPQVSDTMLSLSDVLGRKSVKAPVLSNVFFADGPASGLQLSVPQAFARVAQVTSDHEIRVSVRNASQIIPFRVSRPDAPDISSYGFIWVPGTAEADPQLRTGAKPLTVASGSALTIRLNDYVVAAGGRSVRLTDRATVRATHANGDGLVENGTTLVYTSASGYFGPASISFEVTDGVSASDPRGRTATLVLPIAVQPKQNQPPAFTGGQIDVEPGQQKTIDLSALTAYPSGKSRSGLSYRIIGANPGGFAIALDGQRLAVTASQKLRPGDSGSVSIGVRDAKGDGVAGRVDLRVVASTRPLAVPQPDTAVVPRGGSTVIDVLANDEATNPFPDTPLRVVSVRGAGGADLPPGVTVSPSADNSRLTVAVSATAATVDTNLQYQVEDATGDPSRDVWGSVRISVEDKPDPVANVRIVSTGDRTITVGWDPGPANNSPITAYQVSLTDPSTGAVVGSSTCASTVCAVATPGNGSANAVVVQVVARNAVGDSAPAAYAQPVWSSLLPPAPTGVTAQPLDHGARVSWSAPPGSGTNPVAGYIVTVGSATVSVPASTTTVDVQPADGSLANGTPVSVTVASVGSVYGIAPSWNTSPSITVTPAGPPIWGGAPVATASSDGSGSVALSWAGLLDGNGASVSSLIAVAYGNSAPGCTAGVVSGAQSAVSVSPDQTSTTVTVPVGRTWNFALFADNGHGCVESGTATAMPLGQPPVPTSVSVSPPSPSSPSTGDGRLFLPRLTAVSPGNPAPPGGSARFEYRLVDGSGAQLSDPASIDVGDIVGVPTALVGTPLSIELRSVVSYSGGPQLTSAWSSPTSAGTAVGLEASVSRSGQAFSWVTAPAGPGYSSVKAQCSGQASVRMAQTGSCTATGADPRLTVSVVSDGSTYTTEYR